MRVIFDTNIWISFLISKDAGWIDDFFRSDGFKLIFSNQLIIEFLLVAKRPKIKKYFKESKLKELINHFEEFGILVETESVIEKCRDPNDNFLLELAVDGNAQFLITGDKDLLILKRIGNCEIINLNDWKKKMK